MARKLTSNICEIGNDTKFRLVNGIVRKVLHSLDRQSIFVVTDTAVHEI